MLRIRFAFVCEGTSDAAFLRHLERLCVGMGAAEATGIAPDLSRLPNPPGTQIEDKVRAVLRLEPNIDVLFVHRDADSPDHSARYTEIRVAIEKVQTTTPFVCVIPVQEIEAWLLLDEMAIRRAAGNPNGKRPLALPDRRHIETFARPKERLGEALVAASELSGRRLARFKRKFSQQRRLLIQRLQVDSLAHVPAWRRLCSDVECALRALAKNS